MSTYTPTKHILVELSQDEIDIIVMSLDLVKAFALVGLAHRIVLDNLIERLGNRDDLKD